MTYCNRVSVELNNNKRIYNEEEIYDFIYEYSDDVNIKFVVRKKDKKIYVTLSSTEAIELITMRNLIYSFFDLMMLISGYYYDFDNICFWLGENQIESDKNIAHKYKSNLYLAGHLDFSSFVENYKMNEYFISWLKVKLEMDISFDMYQYMISNIQLPVDIKCAFLIQLAQPISEGLENIKGKTLKNNLNNLICKYGEVIFQKEKEANFDQFLNRMKESRHRLMHAKTDRKNYLNGEESAIYLMKLETLYRWILIKKIDLFDEESDRYKIAINSLKMLSNQLDKKLDEIN